MRVPPWSRISPRPFMIARERIEAIWRAHELGSVQRVVPLSSGGRNECYVVNDDRVIRFNTRDPQFAKFSNERAAYALLAHGPLRVPEVCVLDESRTLVPCDFIIITRLAGNNIAESCALLSAEQIKALVYEAGQYLALLHEITFPVFGKFHELAHRPFPSWTAYMWDYAYRYLRVAQRDGIFERSLCARLAATLEQADDLLACVTQGVFLHSDFHYENILQEHGRISGFLDFEWAFVGDPAIDFVAADAREAIVPSSEPMFLAGYHSVRSCDPGQDQRVAFYRLWLQVETAVTCYLHHDVLGQGIACDRLRDFFNAYAG